MELLKTANYGEIFRGLMEKMGLPEIQLNSETVVSGSCVWWMLLKAMGDDPQWMPNDVDLYVTHSAKRPIRELMVKSGAFLERLQRIPYGTSTYELIAEDWVFFKDRPKSTTDLLDMLVQHLPVADIPELIIREYLIGDSCLDHCSSINHVSATRYFCNNDYCDHHEFRCVEFPSHYTFLDPKGNLPHSFDLKIIEGRCYKHFFHNGKVFDKIVNLDLLPVTIDDNTNTKGFVTVKYGFKQRGKKIQLLSSPLPNVPPSTLICERYDFPTLESYWDGTRMTFSNMDDIVARKSEIKLRYGYFDVHLDKRIAKYEARGITFPPNAKRQKRY